MAVYEASALVEYIARGEHADAVRARILGDREELWAPHLADAEVGHVLRRAVQRRALSAAAAKAALGDLADLPLMRAGHVGLFDRAWALRANLTFHDGLYVALAERLSMPLVTLDTRLAGAPGVRAQIDVIGA